jgi:hypothetical protein
MALRPPYTSPASTRLTKLRIGPQYIPANLRSLLSASAGPTANKSTNAANAKVVACDIVLTAYYQPSAAPAQSGTITAGTTGQWTIDAAPPDFQPGDVLQWVSQSSYNNGADTDDALSAAGMAIVGWGVFGGNLVAFVANASGADAKTPAGYNPQFLLTRTAPSVLQSEVD